MKSHHYSDSIDVLNLSTRTYNALRNKGICSINDLLSHSKDDIKKIRNLGVKSIEEIVSVMDKLNLYRLDVYSDRETEGNTQKSFVGNDGLKYFDIEIEMLKLSVRAYNCLKSSGINYYSQLLNKLSEELIAIPNMGIKSLIEIENLRTNIELQLYTEEDQIVSPEFERARLRLFSAISEKTSIKPKEFFESFENIYLSYLSESNGLSDIYILLDRNFIRRIYEDKNIKSVINLYILYIIKENRYGCNEDYLLSMMPNYFRSTEILNESLNDLLNSKNIDLVYDDRFIAILDSFVEGAQNYLNDIEYDVIFQRTLGRTLEEIGKVKGVTRERIRQIESKAIKKLNRALVNFKEDIYFDIFNKYIITKDDFKSAFKDERAYNYLVIRYGGTSENDKLSKQPLENILQDRDIPIFFKKACEKAIYKKYVKIGNEYLPCNRSNIANYVLKKYGLNDLTFMEFSEIYFAILKDLNKLDDPRLSLMDRGYENKLASSNNVLWKYGKRFRYYNIDSHDFTDLLETMNLNQYENIEFSTLKFFRLYPDLMNGYDIRDEYELHNLLKKICGSDNYPTVNFKRMPNIEFGYANRDNQVMDLLLTLAPISNNDFAKEYEKEYGVSANTVLANYMTNFDPYFYNGVYKIDFPALPSIIADKLKLSLTEDFYTLSMVREIYQKGFPQSDKNLLNPFSLKSIGFKVYSNYAIRDNYSSATEYFNMLLTKNDITNLEEIPSKVKEIIAYTSQLYRLKSEYEIIEFMPNKFINYRKLSEFGITKEMLREYCNEVLNFVGVGKYFTLYSIKRVGFAHKLDDLGFDDWFYTSLLIEDKSSISYQRIGGNKVMISGKYTLRFEEFLEYIVYGQESFSIDINDLSDILKQQYNLNINTWRLIQFVKDSSMYYDVISEKVFADYDIYYEVV
ncbi:MAG: polymerase, alpha subunit domain protein [Bacillales bacterium]|jgi:hypothetical protein|nr:polymerase, alpha subunit domain protein [Bacillales bacterium]